MTGHAHTYAGSYQLIAAVGRGATAEVFTALSLGSRGFERRVVVKRLHEHLCGNPQAEKRFVEEAHLGAQLEHDNIVRVLDLGSSQGHLYMVLEHVDGFDLKSLLASCGALPPRLALHIAREVARGLHYAHTRNDPDGHPLHIVHRDVSPSNILVSRTGQVKVTDFGVAKAEGREKTRAGVVKGKYAYMSPEQVRQRRVDARSDVFSLGAVLAEMLTGERVFVGNGPLEIMDSVIDAKPPDLPREVTAAVPRVGSLIERCFRARDKRLASCRALYVELSGMLISAGAVAPDLDLAELVEGTPRTSGDRDAANSTSITIHRAKDLDDSETRDRKLPAVRDRWEETSLG